ncbi:MAG TPA: TIGR04282 family arsenosugar biosynthesis glycosyltransferase [Planctomycetaceae bacterium]|nr:TIGR04282 family arsenosugar biosynthesis glycosyltransferase [Planctomycetaceae bacterium]
MKTRLAAEWGNERAAELYAAFVADTMDRFRTTGDRRFVGYTPDDAASAGYFANVARGDFELWPQPGGTLGERLEAFFQMAFAAGAARVVVIGSDSPTLPREYVEQAFELLTGLETVPAGNVEGSVVTTRSAAGSVLGPATDGGYYLVGLRDRIPPIFSDVEWSTRGVLRQTVARLGQCGVSLALLPPWYDVDTFEDVELLRGHLDALKAAGGHFPAQTAAVLCSGGIPSRGG